MKKNIHKYFEIVIVLFIIVLSVAIFLYKDQLQNVSNFSYAGLFFLCLIANGTVLLPAPSLMIAASCALIMNPWLVALLAALGSSFGELVGYIFGSITKDLSPRFEAILDKLTEKIHNKTVLVFVLAVLPLPLFDFIGIYSGGTKMNLVRFFLACFIGKFLKLLVYTRIYDILELAASMV